MPIMPGAKYRPIVRNYTRRVTKKTRLIFHSTASASARSMFTWFNQKGANASSHFHVDSWGLLEQYLDTDHISWANGAANSDSITVETQGDGTKPWTSAQLQTLIDIALWANRVHGVPLRQMRGSFSGEKGIGWHRMGVNGNFPKGLLGGRLQNGGDETWSKATGKVCPGTLRIQQMPTLIKRVNGEKETVTVATIGDGKTVWPEKALPLTDQHTNDSHNAWVKLMEGVGHKDSKLGRSMQAWLNSLTDPRTGKGYYPMPPFLHDGIMGPEAVKGLQRKLYDTMVDGKRLYDGAADGNRGPKTVRAEIAYLNSQRKFFLPKPAPAPAQPTPTPPQPPAETTKPPQTTPTPTEDKMTPQELTQVLTAALSATMVPYYDHSRQEYRDVPMHEHLKYQTLSNSETRKEIALLAGQVAGLMEAVSQLATQGGERGEALIEAVEQTARRTVALALPESITIPLDPPEAEDEANQKEESHE